MTVQEAYIQYELKKGKNATTTGISSSRGLFVRQFNEAQDKWTEFHLQSRGVDDVRYIQHLLVLDKNIPASSNLYDHYNFSLPKDYLDTADVRAIASQGECKNKKLFLQEIRTEDLNIKLQDPYLKPSFKWRESLYTVNSNQISIYTDGTFTVDNILLNYYRYPKRIALINPNDPESDFTSISVIEWDDKSALRIISLAAGEFDMNNLNERFQIQNLRTQK